MKLLGRLEKEEHIKELHMLPYAFNFRHWR